MQDLHPRYQCISVSAPPFPDENKTLAGIASSLNALSGVTASIVKRPKILLIAGTLGNRQRKRPSPYSYSNRFWVNYHGPRYNKRQR